MNFISIKTRISPTQLGLFLLCLFVAGQDSFALQASQPTTELSEDRELNLMVARLVIQFLPGGNVSLELVEDQNETPISSAKLEMVSHEHLADSLRITDLQKQKIRKLKSNFENDISQIAKDAMKTGGINHSAINSEVGKKVLKINTDIDALLSKDQHKELKIIEGQRRMQILGWPRILDWMIRDKQFEFSGDQTKSIKQIIRSRREEITLLSAKELDSIYEKINQLLDPKFQKTVNLEEVGKKNQTKVPFELLVCQLKLLDEKVVKGGVVEIARLQAQLDLTGEIHLEESQQLSFATMIQTLCSLQDGPSNDRFHFFLKEMNDPNTTPGRISATFQKQFASLQHSSGELSFADLKKQFSEKMIEYDKEMLKQFRQYLFPGELRDFDLAETKLEIIKIGVINSLCLGRLKDAFQITPEKAEKIKELVESERKRLVELGNKFYRETNNLILKELEPKQRSLLNERFSLDELEMHPDLELFGTPELILVERQ